MSLSRTTSRYGLDGKQPDDIAGGVLPSPTTDAAFVTGQTSTSTAFGGTNQRRWRDAPHEFQRRSRDVPKDPAGVHRDRGGPSTTTNGSTPAWCRASSTTSSASWACSASRCPRSTAAPGMESFKYQAIMSEEIARAGVALRRQRGACRAVPALSEGIRDVASRSSGGCPGSSPARSCSRSP